MTNYQLLLPVVGAWSTSGPNADINPDGIFDVAEYWPS
jgi:hypothetical protein